MGGYCKRGFPGNNLKIIFSHYSDSFVYGALALSLAIVWTNFDGHYDLISLDVFIVLLGYSLFAVINQWTKIVKTKKKKQSITVINNQLTVEIGSSCKNAFCSQDMPKKMKRD